MHTYKHTITYHFITSHHITSHYIHIYIYIFIKSMNYYRIMSSSLPGEFPAGSGAAVKTLGIKTVRFTVVKPGRRL